MVYDHLVSILEGRVGWVIVELRETLNITNVSKSRKKSIKEVIRYFENHREWMLYDKYLKAGYPIGTGVMESTCGHTVKDRMEGTGRRWSIEGAESTLLLRSIYTSNDWKRIGLHMDIEKKRLYHRTLHLLKLDDKTLSVSGVVDKAA